MSIFRAYDVRGIYGADLTEDIAQQIGAAFGTLLGGSGKVVLGRDGRVSSPAIAKAVATGLTEAGCDVLDMGLIPTPALYFGIKASKAKGGIMVTASVAGNTPILIKEGDQIKLVPIESLKGKKLEGISCLSIEKDLKVSFRPITGFFEHIVEKAYRIKYTGGSIITSADHSVFVFDEKNGVTVKKTSELKKGDFLITLLANFKGNSIQEINMQDINSYYSERTKVKIPRKIKLTPELLRLMGYYLAEGWTYIRHPIHRIGLKFGNHERSRVEDAKRIIRSLFGLNIYERELESSIQLEFSNKNLALLFHNLMGGNSKEKHLPPFIWSLPREQVLQFLSGYLCDSHINYRRYRRGRIEFTTASRKLAEELVWLLRIKGISCTIYETLHKEHVTSKGLLIKESKSYVIIIPSIENPFSKDEPSPLAHNPQVRRIPTTLLKQLWLRLRPKYVNSFSRDLHSRTIGVERAKKILRHILATHRNPIMPEDDKKISILKAILNSDIGLTEVKSVEVLEWNKPVYDISVPGTEAFFGGCSPILLHNSHNPPEWNGLKICDSKARLMGMGLGLEKIKEIVEQGRFKLMGNGRVIDSKHLMEEYANFLLSKVAVSKGTRVVLDPGGGSSAVLARKLFERAGCKVYVINEEIDPYFRARSPDPDPDDLEELKEEVLKKEAALGIAFDGDGDRSVFVDDRGRGIQGDVALAVYVRHYLKGKEGAKVVYEVSCTKAIEDITREIGGKLVMCRVGHAFLMDLMLKEKALLGGEISSHFYFGDVGIYSDGLFAGLRMLEVISKEGRLSSLVDELPRYFSTPIITVFVPDEVKFKLVEEAGFVVKEKGLKTLEIDGVRAYTEEGWFLIRASNTKPEIKIRAESTSEEGLKNLFGEVTKVIKEAASRLGVEVVAPKWRYKEM